MKKATFHRTVELLIVSHDQLMQKVNRRTIFLRSVFTPKNITSDIKAVNTMTSRLL